jgi:hypothetical protein
MRTTHFIYACLCLLFSTFQLFAQQGFTAAGGDVNSSNGSVSYSYGQIDYQNYDNQDGKITEGIQQPNSIKEQESIIEIQQKSIENQQKTIEELIKRIEKLEKK